MLIIVEYTLPYFINFLWLFLSRSLYIKIFKDFKWNIMQQCKVIKALQCYIGLCIDNCGADTVLTSSSVGLAVISCQLCLNDWIPKVTIALVWSCQSQHTHTYTHAQPIRFIPANHKCTPKCIHTAAEWLTCQSTCAFPPVIPPLFAAKLVRVNRNCFLDCFPLYVGLHARLSLLYESACVIYGISTSFSYIFSRSNAA